MPWCNINIFFVINYIGNLRNKSCLGDLQLKQTLFHLCHLYFQSFLFQHKYFFSNALRLALNFNNIRNLKHVLTWDTLSNRYFKQKQPPTGVLKKKCCENMQDIYRRTPMLKCDFNKVAKQFYWNCTSWWVFSCKLTAYFQNTFS